MHRHGKTSAGKIKDGSAAHAGQQESEKDEMSMFVTFAIISCNGLPALSLWLKKRVR
jgi:hypothetical protein